MLQAEFNKNLLTDALVGCVIVMSKQLTSVIRNTCKVELKRMKLKVPVMSYSRRALVESPSTNQMTRSELSAVKHGVRPL